MVFVVGEVVGYGKFFFEVLAGVEGLVGVGRGLDGFRICSIGWVYY